MDERMTLEMVRDLILQAANGEGQISRAGCRELADAIDAHLTQPAQAVDVGAIRKAAEEIHRCAGNNNAAFHHSWADKLTRAIGNAQAEGWMPIETAPKDGSRVLTWAPEWSAPSTAQFYGVKGWMLIEATGPFRYPPTHWQPLPTPPTQATPNAHE